MKYLVMLIAVASAFMSCEKIVAEDITGKVPVVILPTSGAQIISNPVHFKWEEMKGAAKYHLMVVSPNFVSPQSYALDTLVSGTDFYYSLDSNLYELKLVGVNAGYRSDTLGPIAFEVTGASGGSSNNLVLTNPTNGAFVNATFNGNFNWNPLSDVVNYEFSLRAGTNFTTGNPLATQPGISTSNYTYTPALTEGEYVWRVTANFSSGNSTFTTHTFAVDTAAPNLPVLSAPLDNSNLSTGTIAFVWSNGNDPGNVNSPVTSRLEISTNQAFTSPDIYNVSGNTTSIDLSNGGTYYWRVMNIDEAGNQSSYSSVFSFIL